MKNLKENVKLLEKSEFTLENKIRLEKSQSKFNEIARWLIIFLRLFFTTFNSYSRWIV